MLALRAFHSPWVADCKTDADCYINCGAKCTCHGMQVHCNGTGLCTTGEPQGELCNISAGSPGGSAGPAADAHLSLGPACAGPNDGLLEVQMAAGMIY
eukprot:SAG31_NODE_62_length_28678_cov_21.548270_31_plen_98_part_00